MKTSFNRIFLWLTVILLSGFGLAGCDVSEDESDCAEQLSVTFKFTKDGQDRFGTDVTSIALFVFDSQGRFLGRWDETDPSKLINGYAMTLPLDEGTYNLVAWGGLKPSTNNNNTDNNGYYLCKTGETQGAGSLPTAGTTLMDEMLVRMMCDARIENGTSYYYVDYIPANQFFGNLPNVLLQAGENQAVIDLTKNNHQITLTIKGLAGLSTRADAYNFSFASPNGGSTFSNTLEAGGNTITYLLQNRLISGGILTAEIHTLRMVFNNGHIFRIMDSSGNPVFQADLLEEYIKKAYATQAAVDGQETFAIAIEFDEAAVATNVTVNGWQVSGSGTGI